MSPQKRTRRLGAAKLLEPPRNTDDWQETRDLLEDGDIVDDGLDALSGDEPSESLRRIAVEESKNDK